MVTTLSPNVRDTPTRPMPTCGKVAAITALPHPANVSQNVPISSAAYFRASIGSLRELLLLGYPRAKICPKSSEILNGGRFCGSKFAEFSLGSLGRKFRPEGRHLAFCLIHPRAQDLRRGFFRPLG